MTGWDPATEGRCPRCGTPLPLQALACPGCGLTAAEAARSRAVVATARPHPRRGPGLTLLALAVVAAVVAVVAAVRLGDDDGDPVAGRGSATTTPGEAPPSTVATPPDVVDARRERWRVPVQGVLGERTATVGETVIAAVGHGFDLGEVVAVDGDGVVAWRSTLDVPLDDEVPLGVVANAQVAVTRVVRGLASTDTLVALDSRDGSPAWTVDLPSTGLLALQMDVTEDLVVATAGDAVLALDPATGDEVWRHDADRVSGSAVDGQRVVVVEDRADGEGPRLTTLDLDTGDERASVAVGLAEVDVRWPLVARDGDAAVIADDGEWPRRYVGVETTRGRLLTDAPVDMGYLGAPLALVGGTIVLATSDTATMLGISLADGSLRWANGHTAFSLAVQPDGALLTRGLEVALVDPADGGATVLVPQVPNVGGTPALTEGGLLVVPGEGELIGYR